MSLIKYVLQLENIYESSHSLVYRACFGFLEGRGTVRNSTAAEVFLSLGWM